MATAPAPATSKTMCRSGSRQESVARRNRSIPPSRTHAIGTSALISQLIRNQGISGSPLYGAPSCAVVREVGSAVFAYPVLNTVWREPMDASVSVDSGLATGFVIWLSVSSISMQSGKQVRDTKECKHHDPESQDCEVSGTASPPATSDAHVEISGINQPGNRRPRLFGVPVPVGTPGAVRPVGAGGDHQGEQGEGDTNRFVGDSVERIGIGKILLEIVAPPQEKQVEQVGENSAN